MAQQGETRYPPGAQILVRDEEWLVRTAVRAGHPDDGERIEAIGVSEFVRDEEAVFFSGIDRVDLLDPEKTRLVSDTSSYFRRARLFLEAVLRRTPLPQSERGLALADRFLLDPLPYQQRPAELALSLRNLRPRILIADVVGLGKTLEIGLTLAELIRRGRGERILVVTPQSVLEQFQHELWTRFAIPLVRLDSLGIQRIQREIPAGRNPFTHYKRVIISVDTLKNIGQYRHHLERIQWDAVVIDESHNLINQGSQRRALAETLAPRTDALLLASATPHNGDKRSFADLISLLDPAAIADADHYDPAEDLGHLFIRRTKISPEVRNGIGAEWADRGPTRSLHCAANEAEERIFAELTEHWLPAPPASAEFGTADRDRTSVATDPLFAYNLLKTFLSSHVALAETVARRITALDKKVRDAEKEGRRPDPAIGPEQRALVRLRELTASMGDGTGPGDSTKLDALVEQLKEIGVGPRSGTRVVVFSERVDTLKWLARVVPARLGFRADRDGAVKAVRVMHGGLSEEEQRLCREAFGLAGDPVRLLFTGDVASEGVNLHRQCHHLIHYDIPWSLIRIEQRNGRIDRYGQRYEPQFRALILTSAVPGAKDDRTVAEKLLTREEEAHKLNGTAEAETGYYRADEEERRLIKELVEGGTVEDFLDAAPAAGDTDLADLFGQVDTITEEEPPRRAEVPSLFGGDLPAFVDTALAELFEDRAEDVLGLSRAEDAQRRRSLSLSPEKAPDLLRRLKALPPLLPEGAGGGRAHDPHLRPRPGAGQADRGPGGHGHHVADRVVPQRHPPGGGVAHRQGARAVRPAGSPRHHLPVRHRAHLPHPGHLLQRPRPAHRRTVDGRPGGVRRTGPAHDRGPRRSAGGPRPRPYRRAPRPRPPPGAGPGGGGDRPRVPGEVQGRVGRADQRPAGRVPRAPHALAGGLPARRDRPPGEADRGHRRRTGPPSRPVEHLRSAPAAGAGRPGQARARRRLRRRHRTGRPGGGLT
ncbi:SNF2-related protein [Streptomyces pratens]|uniref:SNF2-related protein n=1 Tax=Streptomyces pratens TaxID=887456 RepID=A0ABW1M9Y0_9ACTN